MSDRKRAIETLKQLRLDYEEFYEEHNNEVTQAYDMAIASLETDEAYQLEYESTTKDNLGVSSGLKNGSPIIDWNNCHTSEQLDSIATTKNNLGVDCISREATVKRLCNLAEYMNEHKENSGDPYIMAALFIQDNKTEFPSVTPQEPRWIPVSEKLPEDSGEYLVSVIDEYNEAQSYYKAVEVAWFAHKKDYDIKESEWRELGIDEKVIAWMPLPKAYREVEE